MLMQRAYGVKPEQVAGPTWLTTQRYTIAAKLPPKATIEESRLMLQNLLSERFQMRLHRETRTFRVYHLVVSKNGPKLKPAEKLPPYSDEQQQRKALQDDMGAMRARSATLPFRPTTSLGVGPATMAAFVERLSPYLDRPIIDRTQLDGLYSFWLAWVADGVKLEDDGLQGPSVFAALEEQLGLELKSATDQLPVLVIDAAERIPTAN
jgi:uncharacterized protein (TIGR03435 family)